MSSRVKVFSLAGSEADGKKPYLNARGAFVGFGVPLLEQNSFGSWRARPQADLERLFSIGYGASLDLSPQMEGFARIAEALNKSEPALAAITLVQMGLPDLPDPRLAKRMAAADGLCKANYNPQEPRDDHHQKWVAGGGAAAVLARAQKNGGHLWPKDVHPGNEHECVSLVRAVIPGMPHSGGWRPGQPIVDSPAMNDIPSGAAIATFINGSYHNTKHDHAAIFDHYDEVNHRIWVVDQWTGGTGIAKKRSYPFHPDGTTHFLAGQFSTIGD